MKYLVIILILIIRLGLPDGAEPKRLTNTLNADGLLTIQIPVRDYRPPLTPSSQSQQFNLPSTLSQHDSYGGADQQLKLTFDLSGYKPDDVNVKVNNNVLKGKEKERFPQGFFFYSRVLFPLLFSSSGA